jgi:YesN/AraC family two-component response regulator
MFEQNLRILLVNDEYMQLMILENILVRILGIPQENVDKAENGQIANKKAIEGNFDIIIMDLNMPVMNGFTAAKSIKDYFKNEGRICPYIVALSASHID